MSNARWQDEVAELFEQAARALRAKSDRRAISAFGTAIAYLEIARENEDEFAAELLSQVVESPKEGPTARFTFQPGELEALSTKSEGVVERARSAKKKKKR